MIWVANECIRHFVTDTCPKQTQYSAKNNAVKFCKLDKKQVRLNLVKLLVYWDNFQ